MSPRAFALTARRADAVAAAKRAAAAHASLTTPGSAEVIDATDVLAVAQRLQLIAERAAFTTGSTRTACRALRARLDELAEPPKNAELDIN